MMREPTSTIAATTLQRLGESILEAVGTPPDLARIVAASLVAANLAGHDSHGVMRLPSYVEFVRAGRVVPGARPSVESRHGATTMLDGHRGWGQQAARLAAQTAIGLAAEHGVGAVSVLRCNHIGRLGEYVEAMARARLVPSLSPLSSGQRSTGGETKMR